MSSVHPNSMRPEFSQAVLQEKLERLYRIELGLARMSPSTRCARGTTRLGSSGLPRERPGGPSRVVRKGGYGDASVVVSYSVRLMRFCSGFRQFRLFVLPSNTVSYH